MNKKSYHPYYQPFLEIAQSHGIWPFSKEEFNSILVTPVYCYNCLNDISTHGSASECINCKSPLFPEKIKKNKIRLNIIVISMLILVSLIILALISTNIVFDNSPDGTAFRIIGGVVVMLLLISIVYFIKLPEDMIFRNLLFRVSYMQKNLSLTTKSKIGMVRDLLLAVFFLRKMFNTYYDVYKKKIIGIANTIMSLNFRKETPLVNLALRLIGTAALGDFIVHEQDEKSKLNFIDFLERMMNSCDDLGDYYISTLLLMTRKQDRPLLHGESIITLNTFFRKYNVVITKKQLIENRNYNEKDIKSCCLFYKGNSISDVLKFFNEIFDEHGISEEAGSYLHDSSRTVIDTISEVIPDKRLSMSDGIDAGSPVPHEQKDASVQSHNDEPMILLEDLRKRSTMKIRRNYVWMFLGGMIIVLIVLGSKTLYAIFKNTWVIIIPCFVLFSWIRYLFVNNAVLGDTLEFIKKNPSRIHIKASELAKLLHSKDFRDVH